MFKTCKKPPMSIISASGDVCSFNALQAGLPLKSHTVALTATQSGSGTPSPQNIRSINGASVINIGATGRNIFPTISTFPYTASGNVYFYDFAVNSAVRKIPTIHLQEGVEYTLSFDVTIDNEPFNISVGAGSGAYSRDIKTVTGLSSGRVSVTFTPTATDLQSGDIMAFRCPRYGTAQTFTFTIDNVQLEYGGLTDYQPFGTYTIINLGGTYYGGEYDARTGVLTVTHGFVTYDSNNVPFMQIGPISGGVKNRVFIRQSGVSQDISGVPDMLCNIAEPVEVNAQYTGVEGISIRVNANVNNQGFYIYDEDIQTLTEWQDYINNNSITVVYPLATPQTIQLPPCPIDTRFGLNNIFADCGSTTLEAIKIGR